jgi:MFS family permease
LLHVPIGFGSGAGFGPLMVEVSRWFEKRRGIAVAVAASSNYFAGAIWPPLVERGIAFHGWRITHIAIAVVVLVVSVPLLLVLRRQLSSAPLREEAVAAPPRVDFGLSPNALTMLLSIAAVACCVAMSMPQVHIVAYCNDLGYGVARGAEMLSLMLASASSAASVRDSSPIASAVSGR